MFTQPNVVDTYKFMQEWASKNWLNTDELSDTTTTQLMIGRKCGAVTYSSNLVLNLQVNDPSTDWRVAPPLAKDNASQQRLTFGGGSALAVKPSFTVLA